jgi:hypothetical protein
MINLAFRRRRVEALIGRDPCEVTVTRRGRTPDDAATTWSFTARLMPVSQMAAGNMLASERLVGKMPWGLLAPYDAAALRTGDWLDLTTRGGLERRFEVLFAAQYDEKQEVILEERQ